MEKEIYKDILKNKNLVLIKEIFDGYSADLKYLVKDKKNSKYILRISDNKNLAQKKMESTILNSYIGYDRSVLPKCVEINQFDKSKIFSIYTWIEGEPLKNILNTLPISEQYDLGLQSGKILKNIHNIKLDSNIYFDKEIYVSKINNILKKYEKCTNKIINEQIILNYIKNNINNQSIYKDYSYLHGDFHIVNYLYVSNKKIGVIDFERCRIGNKYEDFFSTEFYDREISIPFVNGKIDGYFKNIPPRDFWKALTFHCAIGSIETMVWANNFGEKEIQECNKRTQTMLKDFNNFNNIKPVWFKNK